MVRWVLIVACWGLAACDGFPLTRDVRVEQLDSVSAALDRNENSDVLEFSAIARPDLLGSKTWSVSSNRNVGGGPRMAVMIPLVDEGWTKDQPIAVWVRLDASTHDLNDPKMQGEIDKLVAATRAGPIRVNATQTMPDEVDMDGTNAFTIGARRAMLEHGLVSPTGAVLATWPAKTKGTVRLAD